MADLPVGKPEDDDEAAVAALKKTERSKSKTRHEIQAKASKLLDEIKKTHAEGHVYFDEDDEIIEVPEQIMARMLAGKKLRTGEPPKEEPLKVTKGTITKIGEGT